MEVENIWLYLLAFEASANYTSERWELKILYTCGTRVVLYVVQKLLTCAEGFPRKIQTKGICPQLGSVRN